MSYKIIIDENTSECPACGYRWNTNFGTVDLAFNEKEKCLCCHECGELIEDGDDN